MKAVVLEARGEMKYMEVPEPVAGPGEVRTMMKTVSICGSDIKRYISGHRTYPMILGHEYGGVIDSVGEGVDSSVIGKHVSIIPLVPCFECRHCRRGLYSACDNYSFIGSRQAGGYAEFLVVRDKNVFILPDTIGFEQAALIEPSTVARHMLALGSFAAGMTGAVLGVGSIGLLVVQWLRILKAECIVCVDLSDENLETARSLGAHILLNPQRDNVEEEVQKLLGDGVDVSFEAAGSPHTLNMTIPITRPRGKIVLAGNQPVDKQIQLSFIEALMRKELIMAGSHMSYSDPFPGSEWTDTLDALEAGELDLGSIVSHRYSLAEMPDVFADIHAGNLKHRKIMVAP